MWSQMNTHTSLIDIEISHTSQCQCKVQRIYLGKSSFDLLIKRYRYTNSQRKKKKRKTDNFNEVFPQVGLIRRLAVKRALSVQRALTVLRALTTYTESTDCIESTDYTESTERWRKSDYSILHCSFTGDWPLPTLTQGTNSEHEDYKQSTSSTLRGHEVISNNLLAVVLNLWRMKALHSY